MNDPILEALLEIKSDIGEVRAKIGSLEVWITSHVAEDQRAHESIRRLEMAGAVAKGKAYVWHLVAIAGGSGLGWAVEYLMKRKA